MKCKAHPRYAAIKKPRLTVKNPDGCPTCWAIWEQVAHSPKRQLPTVLLELGVEEARTLVLCIDAALRGGGTMTKAAAERVIRPFCNELAQKVKAVT